MSEEPRAAGSVLVIDDDEGHAEVLGEALEREGHDCVIASCGEDGLETFGAGDFDVVLTDLVMHDLDGMEILKQVKKVDPDVQVVVITGHGSVPSAVQAMHEGASTYLEKPVNLGLLREVVRRQVGIRRDRLASQDLRRQLDRRFGFEGIVGNSEVMRRNFGILQRVAPTDSRVLITGDSGTGKELVAKAIHNNSRRRNGPFIAINCAALAEGVLESELFGHEKGAFTGAVQRRKGVFEASDGGTLFLDEVGDMPLSTQAKLLRVLEEGEVSRVGSTASIRVNVRLIAATNRDLQRLVDERRFREDLFFRLNVVSIELPPLRRRQGDIPLLIESFVGEIARARGKEIDGMAPDAQKVLMAHTWPGNVRELRNCIENMVTLAPGPVLEADDIPSRILDSVEPRAVAAVEPAAPRSLEELEREAIVRALEFTEGNREQAAKLLGIGERTLYRKLKTYELR